MNEQTARSVLKIIAVVTVLVGLILTGQAAIARIALAETVKSAPVGVQVKATGVLGAAAGYAIVSHAVTIVLGAGLYFASPRLAKYVTE